MPGGTDEPIVAPIHDRLGIVIVEASADRVVGTLPVSGNTQPFGALHGGASVVLAESLGSIGAVLHHRPLAAVGVEINATHHRPVTSGTVTGIATPLRKGRRSSSWNITITDDSGAVTCTARLLCLAVDAPEPTALPTT